MSAQAAPSELTQALGKLTPFFWRAFGFSLVAALLVLVPTVYMFELYDRVVNSRSVITLAMLTLMVLLAIGVMETLEWARGETLREAGGVIDKSLAPRVFSAIHDAHLKHGGTAGSQPMVDLRILRDFFHAPALSAALESPVALIFMLILFVMNPVLGWVSLAAAVAQVGISWMNERSATPSLLAANHAEMRARAYVDGSLQHADVVAALGMEANMRRRWMALHANTLGFQAHASDRAGLFQALGKFLQTTLSSALLGLAAWLLLHDQLPGGAGMLIVGSILGGRMLAPLVQMVSQWRTIVQARGAWGRLEQLLARLPAQLHTMPLPRPQGRLMVENLVAGASAGSPPVIRGIVFALQPGDVLAVVGPSAAGKTTLARMLMGLWSPVAGSVRLDGADVSVWNKSELGPHVGYVPQEVELLEGTLAENIVRFGAEDSRALHEAAQAVDLHTWIESLPLGYSTPVGPQGVMLSGGQRQRVALARAVYGTPAFVVLDEPNASLDETGHAALAQVIRDFKARGTTFVVMTHLPSVLAVADKMLVLQDGLQQAFGPRDDVLAALRKASVQNRTASPGTALAA